MEKWDDLSDAAKDSKHGLLRRACVSEDIKSIKDLLKEIPVDEFDGLAMRVSSYHGKLGSIHALLEAGASKPKDLVNACKKYFFLWSSKVSYPSEPDYTVLDKVKPFDVDHTLIFNSKPGITFFNPNVCSEEIAAPHEKHIRLLKRFKEEGYGILVWSHSGAEYTENVIKELKLEKYVDVVAGKPDEYIDDEDCGGSQGWMGQRVWLGKNEEYIE
jgi:hypothetical protein